MRTSLWPTDITEVPAAAPCPKGRRPPGRIQAISQEASSVAETRPVQALRVQTAERRVVAPRISTVEVQAAVVTASGTDRFQAKAVAPGAIAPFPVLPAGVQPAPAAPEVRQAWGPVEVVPAVVGGADELVLNIGREQESNAGCRGMREL